MVWEKPDIDEKEIAREREKAKQLRKSEWWRAEKAKGRCHYCGGAFLPDELTMDHIVPVCRGGHSVKGNLVASCKPCNSQKKHLTPVDIILEELNLSGELQTPDTEP